MDKLPPRIEAFLGRLLINQRGRDAKLLTRCSAAVRGQPPTIEVESPVGPSHSLLPPQYTPLGANHFPELSWSWPASPDNPPAAINSYVLIVEDPDAPLPSPVVHGLYYGIPASTTTVRTGDFTANGASSNLLTGGFRYGKNWHANVWSGPRPVLEHGMHRYFFQLIALKAPLSVAEGAPVTKERLLQELTEENFFRLGRMDWDV